MKNGKTNAGRMLGAVLFGSLSLTGCFRTTATSQDPSQPKHLRKEWDYTDLKQAVNEIAQGIVTSRNMTGLAKKPVIVVYGITNDTEEHIKTTQISDKIQTALNETGAV